MQTRIQGLSTHYIDLPGEKGPVLFLHGWGAHIGLYQPVFDLLQQQGYRVVAFDMPGVGETDEPERPMTVDDYVDFAQCFARCLGITRCILMGHSHGGRVAVGLMTREQGSPEVKRCVLMDAAGVPPHRSMGYKVRQRLYKCLKVLGTSPLTRPLFGELYETRRDRRSSADYKAASPVMRQTLSNVVNADMTPYMPRIRAEVLLIWGEKDTATPLSDGQKMEQLIPGAGLAVIAGGSHFPFVENPAQFRAVLSAFLL